MLANCEGRRSGSLSRNSRLMFAPNLCLGVRPTSVPSCIPSTCVLSSSFFFSYRNFGHCATRSEICTWSISNWIFRGGSWFFLALLISSCDVKVTRHNIYRASQCSLTWYNVSAMHGKHMCVCSGQLDWNKEAEDIDSILLIVSLIKAYLAFLIHQINKTNTELASLRIDG